MSTNKNNDRKSNYESGAPTKRGKKKQKIMKATVCLRLLKLPTAKGSRFYLPVPLKTLLQSLKMEKGAE